ncbi:MAG: hypothetical protein CM15mV13_2580 [uncultured marine virus]|nr:MAG: hypothetical protein CM15mV13_2580 [uncultured marine virus]
MSQLFGYSLERAKKGQNNGPSFVRKESDDAATPVAGGGYFGTAIDLDGSYKDESDLIRRYREMSIHPECDRAVDDVVNEAIAGERDDSPVDVDLANLDVSAGIRKKIRDEFHNVLRLLDFDKKAYDIFRRWYIDGKLYYHKVIDIKNPRRGITELRYIDPRKIRKVIEFEAKKDRQFVDPRTMESLTAPRSAEYYVYNQKGLRGLETTGIKIASDAIAFCHSGLKDMNKNVIMSHLHKAIKALNQLRMIEDSLVIYRLSRAPERRIFYIDVGNLPKQKAEQYLREVMSRYRNKLVYNADTGEIRDDRKFMSMLEDFWLPRREGGRGTEITTLPGGQNLGELEDVKYFQKKLYRALNVPESRLESDSTFNLGRAAEITRDEVKFQKFVTRLRKKFSELFHDLLKTQLVLKGIISIEEWDDMSEHIQYDFIADNYFSELKDQEILNERMNLVTTMDPFAGRYFSLEYIRRQILRQTDAEMNDIDKQMEEEIASGKLPDPATIDPATGMPIEDPMAMEGEGMEEEGQQISVDNVEPADYKRGEF